MNFTSYHFLAFFAVTLVLGHLLKNRPQRIFLLVASYYFYGVFEPWYLSLILFSTCIDYLSGLGIEASRFRQAGKSDPTWVDSLAALNPRQWLAISLTMNLSLLAYFKYTNFGITILNDVSPFGDSVFAWPAMNILLPVGISFYTFQSLSYTIDVYRGELRPRRDIVDFALYVAFFPQLVAGPIVRATTFLKRLDERRVITHEDLLVGSTRIAIGFFRKLVLSDNLAVMVNTVFANPGQYGPLDIWIASIGFGFQIYLDFAGYTDIARGVARLFGFEFEINFLYPMASLNVAEHWSRWHLSLTTWMRDYVFIPLGGSRVSTARLYFNMFAVWFIVGLWHGAAYHFIAWGLWQAVMLAVHRVYRETRLRDFLARGGFVYAAFSWALTFFFLNFGFIWFRTDMANATLMHGREFGIFDLSAACSALYAWLVSGLSPELWAKVVTTVQGPPGRLVSEMKPHFAKYAPLLGLYFLYEFVMQRIQLEYFWRPENRGKMIALMTAIILAILIFADPNTPNFAYFQF